MSAAANPGKNEKISTSVGSFSRLAIKTHFINPGENLIEIIEQYVKPVYKEGDIVSISEKVVSLCQNRIIRKEDMKISRLAEFLSRFASTNDSGIGVNSVWKMQFAIDHCGRFKVIYASIAAGIGKLFGKNGIFYEITGPEVAGLDGFYDKSFAEYGNYGIQLPENPVRECDNILEKTGILSMIVDANDFSRTILGKCSALPYADSELAEMIADNPAGQSAQCTPFILISRCSD